MTEVYDFKKFVKNSINRHKLSLDFEDEVWYKYEVEYEDSEGQLLGFYIHAKSHEDAEKRLENIADTGVVLGRILEKDFNE